MSEGRFRYKQESTAAKPGEIPEKGGEEKTYFEELNIPGKDLMSKVAHLVREGNVLSITVKDEFGNVYFEIPMAVGVIGTVLFPSVAVLGAIGAVVSNLRIVVERRDKVHHERRSDQRRTIRKPRSEDEEESN